MRDLPAARRAAQATIRIDELADGARSLARGIIQNVGNGRLLAPALGALLLAVYTAAAAAAGLIATERRDID